MRPPGDGGEGLAGLQADLFLGVLQEEPHLAFQHVERVGDVGVEMPRHGLRRRELQLADAEAGTLGVAGAALDLVEVAGVLDGLKSCRGCHEKSLDAGAPTNKDKPAPR